MKRVRLDWDSLYVANMEPVADAAHNGDDERVGELLQLMAARLGDGHTFVYGYDRNKCYTPLSTVILDGRVYADEVLSPALEEQGIKHGMELVSVNGIPVAEYGYTHVMPYISSSTPQWSEHTAFNGYNLLATKKGETMRMTFRDGKTNLDAEYTPDGKFLPRHRAPSNSRFLRTKWDFCASTISWMPISASSLTISIPPYSRHVH